MALESQNEKLKEQAYRLLYGLLDEKDAEAFRLKVANDSEVARAFDQAREGMELFSDVSILIGLDSFVETASGSVPLDSPDQTIEAATRISYDSASEVVDLTPETADQEPSTLVSYDSSLRELGSFRRDHKKKRLRRAQRQTFSLGASDPPPSKRKIRRSFYLSVSSHLRSLWQKARLISPTTRLMMLLVTALIAITSLAVFTQKSQLRRYFSSDFRIQISAPRVLTREGGQSIEILTSDYTGAPRRVPVRFCFTDPKTNDFLLAHTESGNTDGKVVYDLPDLSTFPDETLLFVYAGSDELDVFQTFLRVVDRPSDESKALWDDSLSRGRAVVLPSVIARETARLECDSATLEATDGHTTNAEQSTSEEESDEHRLVQTELNVEMRPEIGCLSSNFINRTSVFVSSPDGTPVAQEFELKEFPSGAKLSFNTSELGVGSFEWAPKRNSLYRLSLAKRDKSLHDLQNPLPSDYDEALLKQYYVDSTSALLFNLNPNGDDSVVFAVEPVEEVLGLGIVSRVVSAGSPAVLKVNAYQRTPLVAVVEKEGFVLSERFITTQKGNQTIEIPLPSDLSGLFTISVYRKEVASLSLFGGATFYRLSEEDTLDLDATVRNENASNTPSDNEKIGATLDIVVSKPVFDQLETRTRFVNELPMKLDVYWASDVESAVRSLDSEDLLATLDSHDVEAALTASSYRAIASPPVIFDNLPSLKEHTREKLEQFLANQTKTTQLIMRLGYFGCWAVLLLAFFQTLFNYCTALRGASFIFAIIVIALLFVTLQKSTTSSFRLSEDLAVSSGSERGDRLQVEKRAPDEKTIKNETYVEDESERSQARQANDIQLASSRKIGLGTTSVTIDDTNENGCLLVKVVDGTARRWCIVKLDNNNLVDDEK